MCVRVTVLSGIYYSGPFCWQGNYLSVNTTDIAGRSKFHNITQIILSPSVPETVSIQENKSQKYRRGWCANPWPLALQPSALATRPPWIDNSCEVPSNFGGFGQNDPQNVKWEKNTRWEALSYAKLRLLCHCAWNYLYPFGLCWCTRKKGSKEEKSQEVYREGGNPSGQIPTKLDNCVRFTDVIKRAKFHCYNLRGFGVRCWSFHVAIGNPGRP